MAGLCPKSKLVGNLTRDCSAAELAAGVEEQVYIGHVSDIDAVVKDANGVITSIVMKTGKKMSVYNYQASGAIKPSFATEENEYGNYVNLSVVLPILDNSPTVKGQVTALKDSKDTFVIPKRAGIGGDWEEYGLFVGMKCSLAQDPNDTANNGAYVLTFTGRSRNLPATIRHMTSGSNDTDTFLAGIANAIV